MALHRFRGAIRSSWWCTCTGSFEPPPRVRGAAKGETVRLRRDRQGCDACPMRAPVEILIVEDHTMVAEGLRLAAGMRDDLNVRGVATTLAEAPQPASQLKPNGTVPDTALPARSEERRVGEACVRPGKSRGAAVHKKK